MQPENVSYKQRDPGYEQRGISEIQIKKAIIPTDNKIQTVAIPARTKIELDRNSCS